MAAGDSKVPRDFYLELMKGTYDMVNDTINVSYVADAYSTINVDTSAINISSYTKLSGGNFTADTALTSKTVTRSGTAVTFDCADLAVVSKHASNPSTIKTALFHHGTSGDIIKIVDLTADGGTTAIDPVNNDFDYNIHASGSMGLTAPA